MQRYGDNYFIARRENHKIGFIGEVEGDIRFAIAPSFRGKSLASSMLIVFQEKVTDKTLSGKVKTTNPASIKTFLKAGWKKNPATQLIGGEEYIIFEK
jgi:predicted acetyltransferase